MLRPPNETLNVFFDDDHVVKLPFHTGLGHFALDVRQQLVAHVHVHTPVPTAFVQYVQRDIVFDVHKMF